MIRPFTLITMLLAALSGAYLFAVKHRAQVLDDQMAAIAQASRLDAQRIRVLQAQWALEIDPTRIGQLAAHFTTLQPMKPMQLVSLTDLQETLPPPGSPVPGFNPQNAAPSIPAANAPVAEVAPALPLPPELPPEPPPAVLASAAAPAPAHPVAHVAPHSAPRIAATALAASLPPPQPVRQPAQVAVQAVPMGAQVMSVKAVSSPVATDGADGSALGMGAGLAPPQPLPSDGTDN
jgi:hypothetical protein